MPKRPHRRGEAFFEKALLMNEMKRLPPSELSFRGPKGLFCFQCTEGKQPGSLHLLPPAPWMGACRIYKCLILHRRYNVLWMGACRIYKKAFSIGCFYMHSQGEGERVSGERNRKRSIAGQRIFNYKGQGLPGRGL